MAGTPKGFASRQPPLPAFATESRGYRVAKNALLMHRNPLVSWNWASGLYNFGWVRDPVKPLVLIKDRDRSVSVIRALPLAVDKTRTVTGATKPAAQGQCRLGQLALQAGVI